MSCLIPCCESKADTPGNVPSSPTAEASTAPTEQIITPAAIPIDTTANDPTNNAKIQLMQNQALAIRALASRATASGNPLTQQTMAQLMQAVKSGTLDYNSPGLQQIKTLLALQAQQKQGQASMNPAAANTQQNQASGQGTDQVILAAMRQQMLQQNQSNLNTNNGNGNGNANNQQRQAQAPQQSQQQQQQQQQQAQAVPPQQIQQRPAANRERSQSQSQNRTQANTPMWSGDLIWNNGNAARCECFYGSESA